MYAQNWWKQELQPSKTVWSICSHCCCRPQAEFDCAFISKPECTESQTWENSEVPKLVGWSGFWLRKFAFADLLVVKILPCCQIRFSDLQPLTLKRGIIGVLLSQCSPQSRRKMPKFPDVYLVTHDVAGEARTLILNQNAKAKTD